MRWWFTMNKRSLAKLVFTLACVVGFVLAAYASRADHPNVNTNTSAPGSRNSISNNLGSICPDCRMS